MNSSLQAFLNLNRHVYASIFENLDQGFCVIEKVDTPPGQPSDYRYLYVNPAFETHTGLTNAVGQTILALVPEGEQTTVAFYDQVARTGESKQFQALVAPLHLWMEASVFRIQEQPPQLAVLFTNSTERQQRERQQAFLLKFSDHLRTLGDEQMIEETGLGMLAEFLQLDRAYVFVLYPFEDRAIVRSEQRNEKLMSMGGEVRMSDFPETVRQIEHQTIVFHDIDHDVRLSDFNRTSLQAVNLQAFVCASVRKGERNVLWSIAAVSATPRTWTNDEIELIETVAERLWAAVERARVEAALREEYRRKDEFMAMLGHELRNPLGVISNTLFLLEISKGESIRRV